MGGQQTPPKSLILLGLGGLGRLGRLFVSSGGKIEERKGTADQPGDPRGRADGADRGTGGEVKRGYN